MKPALSNIRKRDLGPFLRSLEGRYNRQFLEADPIFFVHRYPDPKDQEIVAFISSLLAFGHVKSIHASIQKVLQVLGSHPRQFISSFDPLRSRKTFDHLGHRWVRGHDLFLLFVVLHKMLHRSSSLKSYFLEGYDSRDPDLGAMLDRFSKKVFSLVASESLTRGFRYFFPSPEGGSPCKRLNMFLRWMVRPADGIDLGLWPEIPASKLIIPLDTHVYSFARRFRLSRYKNPNWKLASDVTKFLKTLEPQDPVKFDFPICHYGMEVGW